MPYAIEVPDRAPKERYFDQAFYDLEAEQLWPRVWQMACRLEEIPDPGDYRLFAQTRVDGFLHTVPVELTVAPSA